MKKNTFIIKNNGFSLLEITVVLIIISILLSAVIPVLSRSYLEKAANKTALDISAIQDASRKFYIDNNKWPDASVYSTPIAALQAGGYLPSGWNATNPFVNYEPDLSDFSYHILANSSSLKVYTNVPTDAQPIIQNLLPMSTVDQISVGHNVYSSISVPGASSTFPTGLIMTWPLNNLPPGGGFLLCDGTIYNVSNYPALGNLLGKTYGGDGINTFGVPNMQGKTIFGYLSGDSNFGILGNTGGSTTMVGDGIYTAGHTDTYNFVNRVKISGGSLYGMTGAQTAQGVSTAVLNPYITLNYVIKT